MGTNGVGDIGKLEHVFFHAEFQFNNVCTEGYAKV